MTTARIPRKSAQEIARMTPTELDAYARQREEEFLNSPRHKRFMLNLYLVNEKMKDPEMRKLAARTQW